MDNVIGFLVFICLLIIGIYFFNSGKFSATSFNTFIITVLFVGIAFYGFDRLKEFDLKNFKLVLSKAVEVKKEIYAKEKQLRQTSIGLAKLISFVAGMNMRLGNEDTYVKRRKYVRKNCEELLDSLNATKEEKSEAFKILDLINKRDQAGLEKDIQERDRIDSKINELMLQDIEK